MFDIFDDLMNKLSYSISNFERLDLKFEYLSENINEINKEKNQIESEIKKISSPSQKNFLINKLQVRSNNLKSLNSRFENLKTKFSEYPEYYKNKKKFFSEKLDKNLLDSHIHLKFKEEKLFELTNLTKKNIDKTNLLHEKLIENRGRIIKINEETKDMDTTANRAGWRIGFLVKKELYKKGLLCVLAVVLGILDFCLLLRKIHLL